MRLLETIIVVVVIVVIVFVVIVVVVVVIVIVNVVVVVVFYVVVDIDRLCLARFSTSPLGLSEIRVKASFTLY